MKKERIDQLLKLLLLILFVVLISIIYYLYQAVVTDKLNIALLAITFLLLIVPVSFLMLQILSAITHRARQEKDEKHKRTMKSAEIVKKSGN
ncbi:hypothetical protein COX58_01280 [archaeon CG_4_10_14_0_2_um_filter_Archaea_38_6]|nr:MAG: hypothetical protein COS83_00145 [archaeon CG07_land_8_20_14_0_80_38_8]PIU88742.1 MAG: hypothetical protein COS64_02550 [archaeon CG06_land_8_20_14_3_00_37_11]PJA22765.1 MAG: hypothetical protein COX58_01280 [archaeon CG_4_10_14_0_2_um_filter_Archaea_38_6]